MCGLSGKLLVKKRFAWASEADQARSPVVDQERKSAKCHFLILVEQKERPPRGGLSEIRSAA
jgi:hypothetical protein